MIDWVVLCTAQHFKNWESPLQPVQLDEKGLRSHSSHRPLEKRRYRKLLVSKDVRSRPSELRLRLCCWRWGRHFCKYSMIQWTMAHYGSESLWSIPWSIGTVAYLRILNWIEFYVYTKYDTIGKWGKTHASREAYGWSQSKSDYDIQILYMFYFHCLTTENRFTGDSSMSSVQSWRLIIYNDYYLVKL